MSRRKQANPKPIKVLDEVSEETDATGGSDVSNMLVTSDGEIHEQDCDRYEDDLCPLVIDTAAMSPELGALKAERKKHEHSDAYEPLHDLDINQQDSSNQQVVGFPESESRSDALDSTTGTSGTSGTSGNVSWSSSAPISPSGIPKNKTGGRLISPSKTRRKSDKIQPLTNHTGEETYVCPICKHGVTNSHELTRHIRSHNNTAAVTAANTCTICGKALSSQSSLDRHMLVHSGERPFHCHFCPMSFTTNGNMHRHMRIHKKDSVITEPTVAPLAPSRARIKHKITHNIHPDMMAPFPAGLPEKNPSTGETNEATTKDTSTLHVTPVTGVVATAMVQVKQEPMDVQWDTVAMEPYEMTSDDEMADGVDHLTYENQVEPLACSAYRKLQQMSPMKNFESLTSLKPGETLPCPVCDRMFFSLYGIEAHLSDSHPDYAVPCPTCGIQFKSNIAQQRHQLQKHGVCLSKLANHSKSPVPIGFHQLGFAPFSCAQFALIAKAWCELRQRGTSSDTHSFTCQRCHHAFPCYAALHLHMQTHAPELPSTCLQCDCNFATVAAFDDHMTLHSRDKVMAGYTRMDGGDDNLVQDAVSKDEFLLMLNLKSNSLSSREPTLAAVGDTGVKRISGEQLKVEGATSGQLVSRFHDLMTQTKNTTKFGGNQRKVVMGAVARVMTSDLRSAAMVNSSGCTPQLKTIDDMLERDRKDGGGILTCNCCDETFTNIRAYKGHVRAHLGLSPYKCNLCSYSSADKSTLVRHLRTHNGERPFQCLICEFAFTTKANCERHVRKKHDCQTKDEFERAIGYNRYMTESLVDVKALHTPNTVCKYCGEDFKFFRALKHHLRSHSSCQHKPFICRLCHNGFSTKANCVRHVQKQHVDVDAVQMDQCIHINENMHNRSVNHQEAAVVIDKDDTHSESSMSPLPGRSLTSMMKVSSQLFGSGVHVMTPRQAPAMSDMQSEDGDADEPLDFSMKASLTDDVNSRDASYSDSVMSVESQDQPIDLTLRAHPETTSRSPKSPRGGNHAHLQSSSILATHVSIPQLATVGIPQTLTAEPPAGLPMYLPYHSAPMLVVPPDYAVLRYKKEYQQFYNPVVSRLECPFCPMLFKHGLKLMVHIRSHTNERPFNCPLCNIGFTIKTNLDRHLKTKHPGCFPRLDLTQPEDTSSRDTSINAATDDDDEDDDDVMIVNEANNNVAKLSNGKRQSPNHSYSSDSDLTSVHRILDVTDGAKLHALLRPAPSDGASTAAECDDDSHQSRTFQSTTEPAASSFKGVSDAAGGSGVDMAVGEDDQPPTKKKRNSYADSPHKLQCPYCPRAFPWISSLKRHLLTHTGQKPFKCPKCPVTFSTKSNRERHMVRKHGLDIHDPATRQMMDRPYKCHLCVFSSFSTASNLLKHYREKHESAEIPDDLVDTANNSAISTGMLSTGGSTDQMTSVTALRQSIDSQDNMSSVSEMSESQQSAGLEFEEEAEMETEAMEEGLGKKLQEFSSASPAPAPSPGGSTTPTPSHHDSMDSITECWHCAARFGTRRALLYHMKEHGSVSDHPYKCYLCDASYNARRLILEHTMATHPQDWAVLHQKNNLGSDISGFLAEMCCAVTEIESEAEKGGAGGDGRAIESDYSQRKVHCALCPKRFWSLQDLRRHMRSHTGERPFRCDLCEKTFTLKHSMLRHRTRHTRTGGSASDEEGATSSAVNKSLDAVATMNGHIRALERKRHTLTLAANTSTVGSEVQPKPSKGRKLSLTAPAASSTHQVAAGDNSDDSDMLQNLLGVENAAIEQMLNSADSAAQLLGVD